jgi:hypothetical protein
LCSSAVAIVSGGSAYDDDEVRYYMYDTTMSKEEARRSGLDAMYQFDIRKMHVGRDQGIV